MSTDEYVPDEQDMEDRYVGFSLDRMDFPNDDMRKWAERLREEFQRGLARVRRDAALHEKQRIAGEVRLWASINDDLGYTESAETLTRAANDIDRIPEETP